MSEDRDRVAENLEPGKKDDEDVEAHRLANANEEPGKKDDDDDVEAHRMI